MSEAEPPMALSPSATCNTTKVWGGDEVYVFVLMMDMYNNTKGQGDVIETYATGCTGFQSDCDSEAVHFGDTGDVMCSSSFTFNLW